MGWGVDGVSMIGWGGWGGLGRGFGFIIRVMVVVGRECVDRDISGSEILCKFMFVFDPHLNVVVVTCEVLEFDAVAVFGLLFRKRLRSGQIEVLLIGQMAHVDEI